MQCMSPSATWQESHYDLLWTNDSAKCLVCRSQWIKLDSRCQMIQLCVILSFSAILEMCGHTLRVLFYIFYREKDVL